MAAQHASRKLPTDSSNGANFTMICRVQSSKNYFTLEAEKRPGSDAGAVEDTRL